MQIFLSIFNKKRFMISIILAYLASVGIQFLLKDNNLQLAYSNSIVSLIFFIGIFSFYFYFLKKIKFSKREVTTSIFLGFFFSLSLIAGANLYRIGTVNIANLKTWVKILANVPLFSFLFLFLFNIFFPKINYLMKLSSKLENFINSLSCKKQFLLTWILIFIGWVPTLLSTYPGNYVYDAGYQLYSYVENGYLDLHHPMAHTLMLFFFVIELGKKIFHSVRIGLLLYTLFQMLWLSLSFSLIITYMKTKKIVPLIRILFLGIMIFSPYIALLSVSATKNIPYTASLIIFVLIIINRKDIVENYGIRKYYFLFIFSGFINAIFENQGLYVLAFSMLLVLFIKVPNKKELLILSSLICLLMLFYNGPLTRSLNGQLNKDDRYKEMMSVPSIQLSSVITDKQAKITKTEKKEIKEFIPTYAEYSDSSKQSLADDYKGSFNTILFKKDKFKFFRLWLNVGIKNFSDYVDSFAKLTLGYWYPDTNFPDPRSNHKALLEFSTFFPPNKDSEIGWYNIKISHIKSFTWLYNMYNSFVNNYQTQKLPVLSMIFSIGFNVWLTFTFIGWCIIHKSKDFIFIIGLYFGLLGTFLLGPVVLYRYAFSIIMIVPILITIMISDYSLVSTKDNINTVSTP